MAAAATTTDPTATTSAAATTDPSAAATTDPNDKTDQKVQPTVVDDDDDDDMGGLDMDDDDDLTLISSEDDNPKHFEISRKAALMCNLVKSILEGDANAKEIPIKKVRGDILELIVQYLKHHNGKKPEEIAKPIRSVKMERIVADKWDADYINKMNKKTIFQVILGANYMDLPSLLHLGCAKIATLIKGKSPEEIKNILADDNNNDNKVDQKDDNDK